MAYTCFAEVGEGNKKAGHRNHFSQRRIARHCPATPGMVGGELDV